MTNDLALTPSRRTALERVRDGRVRYLDTAAQWLLDAEPITGWAGRTFAELHRADYIVRRSPEEGVSQVDITPAGEAALRG